MSNEKWKPIPGCDGYEASNMGNIRSYWARAGQAWHIAQSPQRIMATAKDCNGYPMVKIAGKTRRVHKLVMETFVGPLPDGLHTCHNDNNPANNHLSNLRYDTPKSNVADTIAAGRHTGGYNRKLDEKQVVSMREMGAAGATRTSLAEKFGVAICTAQDICVGNLYTDCGGPIVKVRP